MTKSTKIGIGFVIAICVLSSIFFMFYPDGENPVNTESNTTKVLYQNPYVMVLEDTNTGNLMYENGKGISVVPASQLTKQQITNLQKFGYSEVTNEN